MRRVSLPSSCTEGIATGSPGRSLDDALQPVAVSASPVDLCALLTATEGLVTAPRALQQLSVHVALGDIEKHPVAHRAPGPWMQRRAEPVHDLAQLLVGSLVIDVRSPAQRATVQQAPVARQQDPLLGQ